jgi:type IV pilus biogenesis/stability protein PilW
VTVALAVALLGIACASGGNRKAEKQSEALRHLRYGRLLLEKGQPAKAIESINEAIDLDPEMADAYNLLGLVYLQQSRFEKARDQFNLALRIDPYYTDAHNHLGVAFREMKKYDRAMKEFQIALKDRSYQTPEKVHLNLGYLYLERRMFDEAIRAFERAVAVNPSYLRGILALGEAFQRSGREDLARDKFLKVVELGPDTREGKRALQLLDGKVQ